MSQPRFNKEYFHGGQKHGIKSFKYTSYPTEVKLLIHAIRQKQITRLQHGVQNGDAGISLTVESPIFCPDYAEINVNRKVPIRQYFGKEIIQNADDSSLRTCYGVGSGSLTVGSDPITNKNRIMCKDMEKMCKYLTNNKHLFKNGNKSCNRRLCFNHVTVLYYLSKSPIDHINLGVHSDVEVSVRNDFRDSNSQMEGTPTVVLSFCSTKSIVFHKRYAGTSKFGNVVNVSSMELNDGDIFVLHPHDERVVQRVVKGSNKSSSLEDLPSQFKHAVSFSSSNEDDDGTSDYAVSISMCFRHVSKTANFDPATDTVIVSPTQHEGREQPITDKQVKKRKLIDNKRIIMKNKDKQKELTIELHKFYASIDP